LTSRRLRLAALASCALAVAAAAAAPAAHAGVPERCSEPGAAWERARPAQVGLDAAKLRSAVEWTTSRRSYAVRVYRYGCLVAEDRNAGANRNSQYESWSMAKSITSMVFGRAMTLGLISPDDPVGALLPEADAAHGRITMRDLLTMTSGLRWNGFRDYNITMHDRIRDALTLPFAHEPGTYYEYAQSAVALLAEAVGRATGEDVQAFAQRELMAPLGIKARDWRWVRDGAGHVKGFMGVNMRPDDFARLGELMRREGVWRGRRLLSRRYVREALTPTATNRGYGWLFWVNRGDSHIGPTTDTRPFYRHRLRPSAPVDMYEFAGLAGQKIAVFPGQGLIFVRTGAPDGDTVELAGDAWFDEAYSRLLDAVVDQRVIGPAPPAAEARTPERPDPDYGFGTALARPDEYLQGAAQPTLPPAGPRRARAVRVRFVQPFANRRGVVTLRVTCPARAHDACSGTVTLSARQIDKSLARPYRAAPGDTVLVRFRLRAGDRRVVVRSGRRARMLAGATNADPAGGTRTRVASS
jgi:CubicO group peptidase (beta-lactamase class C family)